MTLKGTPKPCNFESLPDRDARALQCLPSICCANLSLSSSCQPLPPRLPLQTRISALSLVTPSWRWEPPHTRQWGKGHFTNGKTKRRGRGAKGRTYMDLISHVWAGPKCPCVSLKVTGALPLDHLRGQVWGFWGSPRLRAFRGDLLSKFSTGSMWGCQPAPEVWASPGRSTGVAGSLHFPASGLFPILLISRVWLPVALKKSHSLLVSCHQTKRLLLPLPHLLGTQVQQSSHGSTQIIWRQLSSPAAGHMSLLKGGPTSHSFSEN